jgi:hypothetical protein
MRKKPTSHYIQADKDRLLDEHISSGYSSIASHAAYTFNFGLFKGHSITSVPTDYLIRLRHKAYLSVAEKCTREIERRKRLTTRIINT